MRDAGLVAIGIVIGIVACSTAAAWLAEDVARTDRVARALALRYRGPRVQGEG